MTPFSILSRIEPTATSRNLDATTSAASSFQYPQSDRAHCNIDWGAIGAGIINFQYPQSDRAHCNRP